MTDYRVDIKVKERTANFWRPVDSLTNLEPKEAILVLESKYNTKGTNLTGKRLFEVLGLAWDETARNIDLLLSKKKK